MILVTVSMSATLAKWDFADRFRGYTPNTCLPDQTEFGPWLVEFAGYGCVAVESGLNSAWLHTAPKASTVPTETHGSLVLGPLFTGPLTLQADVMSLQQLRTGTPPNPWEVGWLIWNFQDYDHFYYVLLKPNGWELGKKDPGYAGRQRFLATGTTPQFPLNCWYSVQISQSASNAINVAVNNQKLVTFVDTERPYTSGRLGLYTEDADVHFTNILVHGGDPAR